MAIREAREQIVGSPFGGIETAGVNHVDDSIGRFGQVVEFVALLDIAG